MLCNHCNTCGVVLPPLALMLADRYSNIIQAVIIAGVFCSSPIVNDTAVAAISLLPLRPLFMLKPPKAAIKYYLTRSEVRSDFVKDVQTVIKFTSSKVISNRVRSVLNLDKSVCPNIPNTPTVLLQAEDDNLIPWETQNALENHLLHAQSHWLKSPHFVLQTHPRDSVEYIVGFLTSSLNNS